MKRPCPLLLLCVLTAMLLVAALGVASLAAANPGPPAAAEWQGGAPHKVKASGPVPADIRKAAAAGDALAQAAKKAWEAGGDFILLPDGSKVITLLDADSAALSSTGQAMNASSLAPSSGAVALVNPVQGMRGVQAVVDVKAFAPLVRKQDTGNRLATVKLTNYYDANRTMSWSILRSGKTDSLNGLQLVVTRTGGTVLRRTFAVSGADSLDVTTPRYLKIAQSTNYPMASDAWNVYYGNGTLDATGTPIVAPIAYNIAWYTSDGVGASTQVSADRPQYGSGHFTNVFFLASDGWKQQTADASTTYVVDENASLNPYITTPYWDWGVK